MPENMDGLQKNTVSFALCILTRRRKASDAIAGCVIANFGAGTPLIQQRLLAAGALNCSSLVSTPGWPTRRLLPNGCPRWVSASGWCMPSARLPVRRRCPPCTVGPPALAVTGRHPTTLNSSGISRISRADQLRMSDPLPQSKHSSKPAIGPDPQPTMLESSHSMSQTLNIGHSP